jgi:hypothetical protein
MTCFQLEQEDISFWHDNLCRVQLLIATTLGVSVANRILYKMALVPLAPNYIFFLAQLQTFTYVLVYFSILYARRRCAIAFICVSACVRGGGGGGGAETKKQGGAGGDL